jgi:hypothetical protein
MESDTQVKVENQEKGKAQNRITKTTISLLPGGDFIVKSGSKIEGHQVVTDQKLTNSSNCIMNVVFNEGTYSFELQPTGIAYGDSSYWH